MLLEFSKVFDSVNHYFPCVKFRAFGVHVEVVKWIQSFLSKRTFRVRPSLSFPALSCVPKGSVLWSLLFLLFVSDLPDLLEEKILLFADDVKILVISLTYAV